jgi:hypothetical protein
VSYFQKISSTLPAPNCLVNTGNREIWCKLVKKSRFDHREVILDTNRVFLRYGLSPACDWFKNSSYIYCVLARQNHPFDTYVQMDELIVYDTNKNEWLNKKDFTWLDIIPKANKNQEYLLPAIVGIRCLRDYLYVVLGNGIVYRRENDLQGIHPWDRVLDLGGGPWSVACLPSRGYPDSVLFMEHDGKTWKLDIDQRKMEPSQFEFHDCRTSVEWIDEYHRELAWEEKHKEWKKISEHIENKFKIHSDVMNNAVIKVNNKWIQFWEQIYAIHLILLIFFAWKCMRKFRPPRAPPLYREA